MTSGSGSLNVYYDQFKKINSLLTIIVHCLLWMVFVFHYRQHVVFRAAQAEFLYLFLFGGILILLGIFTWQIYVTSSSCQAAPWLFAVGFTLLVGTVFIRAFRIFLIVRASNKMKRVTPKKATGFIGLLALCSVTWLLLIIWTAAVPVQVELKEPDPIRPIQSYYVCSVSNSSIVLLILTLVWCGIISVMATMIGFINRNFDRTIFDESRPLGFVAYNIVVLSILIIGLQAANVGDVEVLFIIRSILINVLVLFSVLFLFVPKLGLMKIDDIAHTSRSSTIGSVRDSRVANTDSVHSANETLIVSIPKNGTGQCPNCHSTLKNEY